MVTQETIDDGLPAGGLGRAVATATSLEGGSSRHSADEADQRCRKDNDWEGNVEKKDGDERRRSQTNQYLVLECAPADANDGLYNNCQHSRFEAEEQGSDNRNVAPAGIDVAEAHDGNDTRDDEQPARDNAAKRAVHQPADVGGKLLRLGSRQQHAVVERVQKTLLGDPALFFDEDAMHHRDLPGRSTKAEPGNPQPCPKSLA